VCEVKERKRLVGAISRPCTSTPMQATSVSSMNKGRALVCPFQRSSHQQNECAAKWMRQHGGAKTCLSALSSDRHTPAGNGARGASVGEPNYSPREAGFCSLFFTAPTKHHYSICTVLGNKIRLPDAGASITLG
jgi:hypothetical protein